MTSYGDHRCERPKCAGWSYAHTADDHEADFETEDILATRLREAGGELMLLDDADVKAIIATARREAFEEAAKICDLRCGLSCAAAIRAHAESDH